ncbi:hypothetical protein SUGI_0106390 [Cryptomeria japonica]|nr:hypothetical protein SUGI_0106390 [Cryptomeria japonica]
MTTNATGNSNGRQDHGLRPLIPPIPEKDVVAYSFTEAVVDDKPKFKLKLHSAVRSSVSFQKSDKGIERQNGRFWCSYGSGRYSCSYGHRILLPPTYTVAEELKHTMLMSTGEC